MLKLSILSLALALCASCKGCNGNDGAEGGSLVGDQDPIGRNQQPSWAEGEAKNQEDLDETEETVVRRLSQHGGERPQGHPTDPEWNDEEDESGKPNVPDAQENRVGNDDDMGPPSDDSGDENDDPPAPAPRPDEDDEPDEDPNDAPFDDY